MPGPVAFGVYKALDKKRASRPSRSAAPGAGWFVFVVSAMCLSWAAAGLLSRRDPDDTLAVRLWWASVYYALTMGWQPLVAAWVARHWRDDPPASQPWLRWPRVSDIGIAIVVATSLAGTAMIVARTVGEPAPDPAQLSSGAESMLAVAAAIGLLCLQAVTEEYGWRGAPLAYAIERWGRVGLVVHGAMWGVWYAPLFILSSANPQASLTAAGGFVITCMLLGVVFSWLRLRSRSVLPSAIANALLTIVAGLPLLWRDGSIGIRDAVFRWPGWPFAAVLALVLLFASKNSDASDART